MTTPRGMRQFGQASAGSPLDTPGHIRRLARTSLPWQVGPYFATADADPVPLGEYAAFVGKEVVQEEHGDMARLGTDGGYEICAGTDGEVRAVLLDYDEPSRYVNSTPETFAASLQELERGLHTVLGADRPPTAAEAFDRTRRRLVHLDRAAFADEQNWWPLVLDDIRDTATAEWYAAFEYLDAGGQKRIVTQTGGIALHPEERLWSALRASGIEPDQVLQIHTELEPCFLPGHYCSLWMAQTFPEAALTHNFPYGESAASRAQGIRMLREAADRPPR